MLDLYFPCYDYERNTFSRQGYLSPFVRSTDIFCASSTEVEKHLAFRDLMRADSVRRTKYQELKLSLFSQFSEQRELYQKGKSDFIAAETAFALATQNRFRIPVQVFVWIVCQRDQETKFLLLKRSTQSGGFWQGVTGAPFPSEIMSEAAARELFEETGLSQVQKIEPLDFGYTFDLIGDWKKSFRPEVEKIVEHVFYTFLDQPFEPRLSDEHDSFRWCTYEECLALLKWQSNKESLRIFRQKISGATSEQFLAKNH